MITDKSKRKLKNQKKLKSFRNRMGSNIVWFDSLTKQRQYDLLFEWEQEKYQKRFITVPKKESRRSLEYVPGRGYKTVWKEITIYPASLKHFIRSARSKYKTSVDKVREAALDILLKNK